VLVLRRIAAPQVAAGPAPHRWRSQAVALAILVAYALTLPVLGFVVGTAVASGALSKVFGGRLLPGLVVGLLFGVGLFSLFALGFGLELPVGVIFGRRP
jgi:putative tricarboxylic transport membrane protein